MDEDGYIHMPTLPGLGEDINFDYIAERTVSTH
jgi:L-alanine-DL-glutamate epimerase-like enolase superfamily enzyme